MNTRAYSFGDAVLRLFLRSIPVVPGPELYDVIRNVRRTQDDVEKQVQEAVEALSRSSQLIDNLSDTLKTREKKLHLLKEEYERTSHLASLTAEQGEAVAKSLQNVLGKSQGKERVYAFFINIVAGAVLFVVGVFASDWVKNLPTKLLPTAPVEVPKGE